MEENRKEEDSFICYAYTNDGSAAPENPKHFIASLLEVKRHMKKKTNKIPQSGFFLVRKCEAPLKSLFPVGH